MNDIWRWTRRRGWQTLWAGEDGSRSIYSNMARERRRLVREDGEVSHLDYWTMDRWIMTTMDLDLSKLLVYKKTKTDKQKRQENLCKPRHYFLMIRSRYFSRIHSRLRQCREFGRLFLHIWAGERVLCPCGFLICSSPDDRILARALEKSTECFRLTNLFGSSFFRLHHYK